MPLLPFCWTTIAARFAVRSERTAREVGPSAFRRAGARDEDPAAFARRCVPRRPALFRSVSGSETAGIFPRRTWSWLGEVLPTTGVGATRAFHHGLLDRLLIPVWVLLLRGYRVLFSPLFAGACRFEPSCLTLCRGGGAATWQSAWSLAHCAPARAAVIRLMQVGTTRCPRGPVNPSPGRDPRRVICYGTSSPARGVSVLSGAGGLSALDWSPTGAGGSGRDRTGTHAHLVPRARSTPRRRSALRVRPRPPERRRPPAIPPHRRPSTSSSLW